MKPTRRIKVKNGIEYWYEETPYYDKEKKQIRHRSKYLGRNVDGQPVRMRSAPGLRPHGLPQRSNAQLITPSIKILSDGEARKELLWLWHIECSWTSTVFSKLEHLIKIQAPRKLMNERRREKNGR